MCISVCQTLGLEETRKLENHWEHGLFYSYIWCTPKHLVTLPCITVLSDCFLKIYLVYSYSGTPCILSPLLTPDFCTFWPVYDWPGGSVPLLAAWPAGKPGLCLVHRPLTEGGVGVRLDIKSQPTNNGNPRHKPLPRNPPTKFFVKNSSKMGSLVMLILRQNQNITLFKQATFGNYFEIYQHVCIESVSKNTFLLVISQTKPTYSLYTYSGWNKLLDTLHTVSVRYLLDRFWYSLTCQSVTGLVLVFINMSISYWTCTGIYKHVNQLLDQYWYS